MYLCTATASTETGKSCCIRRLFTLTLPTYELDISLSIQVHTHTHSLPHSHTVHYVTVYLHVQDKYSRWSFGSFSFSAARSASLPSAPIPLPCATTASRGTGESCCTHSCLLNTPHAQLRNQAVTSPYAYQYTRTHTRTHTYTVSSPPINPTTPDVDVDLCQC